MDPAGRPPADAAAADRWRWPIWILSGAVCLVVAFLILGPRPEGLVGTLDVSGLPAVNATLNSVTAILLIAGFVAIRAGRWRVHRGVMLSAFATSTAFLLTYVVYHWFKPGPVRYVGDWRALYLVILISHILLAVVILPLALTALARGLLGAFEAHKRIARPTLAVWLYVSVTGILIYWMAHP